MKWLSKYGALVLGGLVLTACGGATAAAPGPASSSAGGMKVVRLHDPLEALAMEGGRVAYDVSSDLSKLPNRVLVWNVGTGKTTKVSGRETGGADGVTGGGVPQLAIAGTRVAWLIQSTSNEESDDDLYTSSLLSPKERHVAGEVRSGNQCGAGRGGYQPACAGTWLGGVVGSGNRILVNRWTTDTTGAVSNAGLYELNGTKFGPPVVTGSAGVEAVAADSKRVAVLQWRWIPGERTIHLYSSSGRPLVSVTPNGQPEAIALSGRNLVVLEHDGKLADYDARTGSLRRTFALHGSPNQQVLAVQGNVAVYSTPVRYYPGRDAPSVSGIRAIDLTNGRTRLVGRLPGQITLARIDSTGLVYTNDNWTTHHGYVVQLVFVPFEQVAAAVGK